MAPMRRETSRRLRLWFTIRQRKLRFPANVIPANLIDPAALKILGLVPAPDSPGTINKTDNIATNNFVSIGSSHPTTNTGLARLDETVTNSLRLFGTFIHFNNYSPIQPIYPGSPLENAVGNTANHRLRIVHRPD